MKTGVIMECCNLTGSRLVLATLIMLALQISSSAQFAYVTNVDDTITVTGYSGAGGNVTIPNTVGVYPVTAIGASAFFNKPSITGVMIPNSIIIVKERAFEYCTGITSVSIPDGVTNIGAWAFFSCSSLTNVLIPQSTISIDTNAFGDCSSLTNIDVDAANKNYVTMGSILFDKALITLIQFPAGMVGNYVIPNSVIGIGRGAFIGCNNLTNVTIPDSITNIGDYAFSGCSSLTSIRVPGSVASIGYEAFQACSHLKNVTIGSGVTSIGDWGFHNCFSLTDISIPDSVNSIGNYAFAFCSSLTNVIIGNGLTNIGNYVFQSCSTLHQVHFLGDVPKVNGGLGSADGTVFYWDSGVVYYVPGTAGWGGNFGGWPAAQWYQPQPQILGSANGLGIQSNGFQFTISWATNTSVVIEASTNLEDWAPVITNALVSGTNYFSDSSYTNFPKRFYRVRSQ